jgi:hypothetical protein
MGIFSSMWKLADQAKKNWKSSGGKKKRKGSRKSKRR